MAQTSKASPPGNPSGSSRITSRDNWWLKRFRSALRGEETDEGLVGVEGVRFVEAALSSGLPVEVLLVSQSGERHLARLGNLHADGVRVLRTTDRLFAGIADTTTPQGIAALVQPMSATVDHFVRGTALITVLVGVQDPGNVGTILRASEAFGASGAATCSDGAMGTADPFGPKAVRASAGSALRLPILRGMSATILLAQLRVLGVRVYAAVADGHVSSAHSRGSSPSPLRPWEIDWKAPSALLIGNEGSGLSEQIVGAADATVSIPHATPAAPVGVESLNAAMAASVLLYEAMRQRM